LVGADDQGAGSATERLWLYHGHAQPIRLRQDVMREVRLSAEGGKPREVARATYTPGQALGLAEIRAHESRNVAGLAKLTPVEAGVLRSAFSSGFPVRVEGSFRAVRFASRTD